MRTGPNLRNKLTMLRLCSKHFVTGAKSDDPLHIDYVPIVFAFLPVVGGASTQGKEKVLIDMKDLKNAKETKVKKRTKRLSQKRMKQHFM